MRVFVTGATGFVGSAVVPELIAAGHEVVGLARSDEAEAALKSAGAEAHRGGLDDPDGLARAAAAADGVIHLAFIHDFSDIYAAGATDLGAIEAIGAALAGSGKPFLVTSGTGIAVADHVLTEEDGPAAGLHRTASEEATVALAERGVRAVLVRLAPSVHGRGDHGFVPRLIEIAREKGVSACLGDGANRWPGVHRLDAARLYRLALESAPAGTRLHATDEEGVPFRDIAAVIGRHLDVPVVSVPREQAEEHFGWLGRFAGIDNATSSARTRTLLRWEPREPGLLADLDEGHYFDA
ncbi:nucleoside-diphosphate-sugar epimerase [Streptomyces griseochromogenes]|uniref:3-beta hydroxysteroid dehydrogenase n=1 Tax=Streptomyces griseochromogenes TaxID=68214 RepID=A0A1B1B1Y7_9ACTN|nr:SDR family oxidoreductase [Streptomyces griseochromogenes]ANP52761.1 3-beta hydroxysteroid dehydrogenase [Streptomyces griseochromogenes]MBP2047375.1 nucleoside-diphosphate-sugar epimerase [Streptomyces griseochromogenes]